MKCAVIRFLRCTQTARAEKSVFIVRKQSLNLPSVFTYPQDIFYRVIQQIRADSIRHVISFFFSNFLFIRIIMYASFFAIFCCFDFSNKSSRIVWVLPLFFHFSVRHHFSDRAVCFSRIGLWYSAYLGE